MNTILLALFLAQPAAVDAKMCLASQDMISQQPVCCVETSGRQCCAKSQDKNGKPVGCDC
jgi:hypothetical protein